MGYAQETGYVPLQIEDIMQNIMLNINTQFGTTYTLETFVGTNFYKHFYAAAQEIQKNEVKTSEIFAKLQNYFKYTNEKILNPEVTPNGLLQVLKDAGYTASIKPMIEADAGKINVCVDVDDTDPDYAATKLEICTILKDNVVAGVVSMGTESETLTLTNGQAFDFKYHLPDRTDIYLRLTITLSRNNENVIGTPEESKEKLLANIAANYKLGKDFEPERYFTVADAPWAADILLEYSEDESTWESDTFEAEFDELFVVDLARIEVVEV